MAASPKSRPTKPDAAAAAASAPVTAQAKPAVVGVARARFVRGSTHKTREVARLIRTRRVTEALAVLAATNKRPARTLSGVVKSAAANAIRQHPQLTEGGLRIARIIVDDGPMWKRFRAAAMGRATRIRKRTSHITVELVSHQPEMRS